MCLFEQDSEYASSPKYAKILNMAKFSIWKSSQYASVTQRSKYRVTQELHRALNMSHYS